MEKFNIFKILEKHDKELIHSSFLKYLLDNYDFFYESLFKASRSSFEEAQLEKSYKKQRFDIEILSKDNREVIVIENKFKCFPKTEQLKKYNSTLKSVHKGKKIVKYLFCFDSNPYISEKYDWNIISYSELLSQIVQFLKQNTALPLEEKIFIEHYKTCLEEYFNQYEYWINNLDELFSNTKDDSNKFWLRLIYSRIANLLENQFQNRNVNVEFNVCPGNTTTPLIDIEPLNWMMGKIKRYVQFQGEDVKFYIRTADKQIVQNQIDKIYSSNLFNERGGELKTLSKRKEKSSFIYKEKLTKKIPQGITLENITDYIMDFYSCINKVIM